MPFERRCLSAALCAALAAAWTMPAAEAQTIVLVRHAEKVDSSKDPDLSDEGRARASRLATMLADAGVSALFATQYARTQQTVAPLAAARSLTPAVMHSDDIDGLAARLRALSPDAVAVYAGHSGSVPKLLSALGHQTPPDIDESDYSNLFIVSLERAGPSRVVRLRY
jgi:phosphohistidine phosphatase SixA